MRSNTAGSLAYVRGNGRITRDSLNVARFSFVRLYCVIAIVAVLFLTNPANGTHGLFPKSWWQDAAIGISKGKSPNSTSTWFKFWLPTERTTNYGIFALHNSNRDAPVRISGLLRSTILCHRRSDNELTDTFCNAIAKNLNHGNPILDWNRLAYSTCRMITVLLLISRAISFCAYELPLLRSKKYPGLDALLSLFQGINFFDIVRWNVIGYPALRSMEQTISLFVLTKDAVRLNMGIGCCILILGLGSIANYIGTWFRPNSRIIGIDGVLAACHGYNVALGQSKTLFSVLSIRIDNTTYFWFDVGRLLLLSGNHGLLATVVMGGMLGHVFGTMHPHWLLELPIDQAIPLRRGLWG